jgi:hypothetical protein
MGVESVMLRAFLAFAATAAAAFMLGWTARARSPIAAAEAATPVASGAPASATACVDDDAMKANQNLVDQLQESRRQRMIAEAQAHLAELKSKAFERERAKPGALRSGRDEWSRMAKDGKVRLRTPCSSWSATSGFRVVMGGRHGGTMRHGTDVRQRAIAAGLEDEDTEALAKAYENAHTRTWRSIQAACEEGPLFREAISESSPETDADRVAICQASLLPNDASVRGAMRRVAESRAAGNGGPGAAPEDRVAFALSESVDVLYDEMKKVLGEEKATRAVDFGVLCTNEASYDLTEDEG